MQQISWDNFRINTHHSESVQKRLMCENQKLAAVHLTPTALFLGHRMDEQNKVELIDIAEKKGIVVFEAYVDYENPHFRMGLRHIEF